MASERIRLIAKEAAKLFLTQGYSRTQISHIAKAVGVSVGTIYHDFNGKQEIMHFVLKSTIEPSILDGELERPITDDIFDGLQEEIMEAFEENGKEFARHLPEAGESYTLEMLISDAFDLLEKYAVGCLFIEKNQFEFKTLAKHYKKYRQGFLDTMSEYLDRFISKGVVRPLENVQLTTVLIVEILSWWAMDMRFTSFETHNISQEAAKKVCMDNIAAAYKNS